MPGPNRLAHRLTNFKTNYHTPIPIGTVIPANGLEGNMREKCRGPYELPED